MVFQLVSRSWGEVFGDKVLATAILDRLLHYIKVISLRGDRPARTPQTGTVG